MAIHATEGTAPEWFTPESEKVDADGNAIEPTDPARFHIQPMNQVQMLEVHEHIDYESGRIGARGVMLAMRYGLKDWKGIYKADGAPMDFRLGRLTQIPFEVQEEVASRIFEISQLGEEARKN